MMRFLVTTAIALALTSPAWADNTTENAGVLLAAIGFVDRHCPDMEPNPATVRRLFAEMGYRMEQFAHDGPREVVEPAAKLMVRMENAEPGVICTQTWRGMGPEGTVEPGVFGRKR